MHFFSLLKNIQITWEKFQHFFSGHFMIVFIKVFLFFRLQILNKLVIKSFYDRKKEVKFYKY